MLSVNSLNAVRFNGYSKQNNVQNTVSFGNQPETKNLELPKNFTAAELLGMIQAKGGINLSPPKQDFKEVSAKHILIKGDSLEQLKDIKQAIDSGVTTFEEAAKNFSDCPSGKKGGDLGFFEKGMMVKPFEEAAFNAEKGQIVGPIKTDFGYHLIKVEDKR